MHGTSVTSLFQALSQATTRLISTVRTVIELDEETGLYYYGARYLDPKYSIWISTDPALVEYIPKAPIDEEAKKYNQNLPGMGVFNHINGNLYHYAGNNPVKYTDPDGQYTEDADCILYKQYKSFIKEFETKTFTKDNPLNQLEFDKVIRFDSDGNTTKSCLTVAIINAYAANCKNGITGKEILNTFLNSDDSLKILIDYDGSPNFDNPNSLNSISKALAIEKGLDKYIHIGNKRSVNTIFGAIGEIIGLAKKSFNHFIFKDKNNNKIDSLDPNRPGVNDYKEVSQRALYWRKLDEE